MFNVSVRITDAATSRPTPVRLRITDMSGEVIAPLGRLANFTAGSNFDIGGHLSVNDDRYFYIDGRCEIPLPGGEAIRVEVTKGPEFLPYIQLMQIGAGQMALRLSVSRWADLRSEGWYSGDTRCHFLAPHAAVLEGQAEDLATVNLLALHTFPTRISNILAFSGQRACLESETCVVAVNTYNAHAALGKLALLHCHRPIFPLNFGEPFGTDDWSLADWCHQCHRKKGLVVWCEPFAADAGFAPEALADLVLGYIDAVEVSPQTGLLNELYHWWSAGIRAPIVGASAKDSNCTPLGAVRTYAKIAPPMPCTYTNWIEAVRTGNTFATSGPILEFSVDGQPPGRTLDRQPTDAPLKIRATVRSASLPGPLEILEGGEVIARTDQFGESAPFSATLEREYPAATSTWLAARCVALPSTPGFAHTSPVFVHVAGRPPTNPGIAQRLAASLEKTCEWIKKKGRFEFPPRKDALLGILRLAQDKLRG